MVVSLTNSNVARCTSGWSQAQPTGAMVQVYPLYTDSPAPMATSSYPATSIGLSPVSPSSEKGGGSVGEPSGGTLGSTAIVEVGGLNPSPGVVLSVVRLHAASATAASNKASGRGRRVMWMSLLYRAAEAG